MVIYELASGDKVHRYKRCLVIPFGGKRKVMSTSMHNGGYREDLTAIFNHDVNPGPGRPCVYCQPGHEEERKRFITDELGLDYETVAYMATIVSMDNAAIKTLTYDELTVTVIATASLEVNGGRAGEEATCYEKNGERISLKAGTINIMVFVNADMTPGAMACAIMIATEAKAAVLQELMAGSLYSTGIATGSGTDNVMIVADAQSVNTLTYAGKHGKLGELIGCLTLDTVRESLGKHMGLTAESRHSMLSRLKRYNIGENNFCAKINAFSFGNKITIADFIDRIHKIDSNGMMVTLTSLYIHLMDQLNWGLISGKEAVFSGKIILKNIAEPILPAFYGNDLQKTDTKECIDRMLDSFIAAVCTEIMAGIADKTEHKDVNFEK